MAGLRFPLSTLHVQPRGCPRMTRGHDGSATPFMWGSFIPYSMPVYPGAFTTSPYPLYYCLRCLTKFWFWQGSTAGYRWRLCQRYWEQIEILSRSIYRHWPTRGNWLRREKGEGHITHFSNGSIRKWPFSAISAAETRGRLETHKRMAVPGSPLENRD